MQWELALDQPGTANAGHVWWSRLAMALIIVMAAVIARFGETQLPAYPQFTTFHASFVFIADSVTGILLLGQFRYRRLPSYLFLACGYLFSALVTIPFLLTFPGAIVERIGVLGSTQSSIWVWHFWHILFPVFVMVALNTQAGSDDSKLPQRRIAPAIAGGLALVILLVVAVSLAVTLFHDDLPILITPNRTPLTSEFYVAGGAAALLAGVALLQALQQAKRRSILHIWLAISLSAFLADILSSLGAHARFTLGWYGGRIEAIIAASILLPIFLGRINLLYRQLAQTMDDLSASNRQLHSLLAEKELLVARLEESEKHVRHLAYHDTLTNLPNRRLLMDRLQQALAQAKRYQHDLALMFIDLDRFKEINDTLGHDVGDDLLRQVASRLAVCVRIGDTVSRSGGDEFIILLPEIDKPADSSAVAGKIIHLISEPFSCLGHRVTVTCSVGIALCTTDCPYDAQELIGKADSAMYQAKQRGRNQFVFSEARQVSSTPNPPA